MEPNRITPAEVKLHLDRGNPVVFVDSRNDKAWQASDMQLPGAVRVPAKEAEQHLKKFRDGKMVVTYCT